MKNITVLQLAEKLMIAHNETCNYETFSEIELNIQDESISFNIQTSMIGTADMICNLLNLTLHIEVNSDPQSDKQLNFCIN